MEEIQRKIFLVCSIKVMDNRAQRMREEETSTYMSYRDGKLSQKEYVNFKLGHENRMRELEKQAEELAQKRKSLEKVEGKYLNAVKSLLKLKEGEDLTAELVEALVEKVYVYPGKRFAVQFRYVNEMLERVG